MDSADSRRKPWLDLLRGVAALSVCAGHARAYVFVDYSAGSHSPARTAFYLLTGRHHQAVMIFFVLSGFLVGGSVVRSFRRREWSWGRYCTARLTRLWIVMLPALLLTMFWDGLGRATGSEVYDGYLWPQLHSGPSASEPGDWSFAALIGNLCFVQTIFVPVFGSNGPLWSLANEFWYYLLFPLLFASVAHKSMVYKIASISAVLVVALILPHNILIYFSIWLLGVLAFYVHDTVRAAPGAERVVGVLGLIALASALLASLRWSGLASDIAVGAATAAFLPWLCRCEMRSRWLRTLSMRMSDVSYTLYLVHFPLFMFLYATLLAPRQFDFSIGGLSVFLASLLAAIAYAVGIWFLFERNTDRVRSVVNRLVFGSQPRPQQTRP